MPLPSPLPDSPTRWEGWRNYNSDNPYERLCLAFEANPSDEQIEENCRQLLVWWQKKLPLKNQPSNPATQMLRQGIDDAPKYLAEARTILLQPGFAPQRRRSPPRPPPRERRRRVLQIPLLRPFRRGAETRRRKQSLPIWAPAPGCRWRRCNSWWSPSCRAAAPAALSLPIHAAGRLAGRLGLRESPSPCRVQRPFLSLRIRMPPPRPGSFPGPPPVIRTRNSRACCASAAFRMRK